jgi:hypothetical protein
MISNAKAKIATLATQVETSDACLGTLLFPSFEPAIGRIIARKKAAKPKGNRISSMLKPLFRRICG